MKTIFTERVGNSHKKCRLQFTMNHYLCFLAFLGHFWKAFSKGLLLLRSCCMDCAAVCTSAHARYFSSTSSPQANVPARLTGAKCFLFFLREQFFTYTSLCLDSMRIEPRIMQCPPERLDVCDQQITNMYVPYNYTILSLQPAVPS